MVVTRLWEVGSKGTEWASSSSSSCGSGNTSPQRASNTTVPPPARNPPPPPPTTNDDNDSQSSSYWNYATSSLSGAAVSVSGIVSSLYNKDADIMSSSTTTAASEQQQQQSPSYFQSLFSRVSDYYYDDNNKTATTSSAPMFTSQQLSSIDEYDEDHLLEIKTPIVRRRASMFSPPWTKNSVLGIGAAGGTITGNSGSPMSDLVWMFRNNKNPYNSVRGRDTEHTSMTAVRSLVALVPSTTTTTTGDPNNAIVVRQTSGTSLPGDHTDDDDAKIWAGANKKYKDTATATPPPPLSYDFHRERSLTEFSSSAAAHSNTTGDRQNKTLSSSETASQLAEGTIRALRDLALDEAVELQTALRYWNKRWERPLLSWLEAGPFVWFSKHGYNHQEIGRKVSQIQAVLARRCAAIGELQQHLLRAGWHMGVAQWGVLGHGGQWAAVAGFDGRMPDSSSASSIRIGGGQQSNAAVQEPFSPEMSYHKTPPPPPGPSSIQRETSDTDPIVLDDSTSSTNSRRRSVEVSDGSLPRPSSRVGLSDTPQRGNRPSRARRRASQAEVYVGKKPGEGIFIEEPEFLAEWSVDAMALVRRHLYRAGNGRVPIPCESNWIVDDEDDVPVESSQNENLTIRRLPLWADETIDSSKLATMPQYEAGPGTKVKISDLPMMVSEVEELLDVMEFLMELQRRRRLDRLRPYGWLRSNWYVVASVVPSLAFLGRKLSKEWYGADLISFIFKKVTSFFVERVHDPVVAIFKEVWQGRESFSDQKARLEATESLKKMIRSWLDDTCPEMPASERSIMAETMDVTLVERKKEESMKTFYEINNVVRMSFIEMQYMKKELLNALHAIDEMMSANDINMNIAAITPAVMLVYLQARIFRFCFYALLRLGTSREETYASFRLILTDIERLLVMRNCPPNPPPPRYETGDQHVPASIEPCVLGSDDLGMLMLLIHECRSILWNNRRRFSEAVIRSVTEDLAELAGERGAVSVQQQLLIVERMCRTYPFLKVISTGHLFEYRYRHSN